MPSDVVNRCSEELAASNLKIAFIESATAGRMCAEFALTEQSGKILLGGISCYDLCVKESLLEIPHGLVENFTAESKQVTAALARSGQIIFGADITVAVTGLTTPGGSETEEKPVGTMFLHLCTQKGELSHQEVHNGNPEDIIIKTIDRAARLILQNI